jgi:hypothetical protein
VETEGHEPRDGRIFDAALHVSCKIDLFGHVVRHQLVAGGGTDFDVVRSQIVVAQVQATVPPLEAARRTAVF